MHRNRFIALAFVLMTIALVASCSSDSKSSNGDKAAFCKTNGELNSATNNITSPADLASAFKANSSKLDDALKNAPSEIKADVQKLVTAAKQVASSGDPSPFINDQSLQTAGQRVDAFCGQSSSSS